MENEWEEPGLSVGSILAIVIAPCLGLIAIVAVIIRVCAAYGHCPACCGGRMTQVASVQQATTIVTSDGRVLTQNIGVSPAGMGSGQQGMAYGQQGMAYGQQGMVYGPQGMAYGQQGMAYGQQGMVYGPQGMSYGQQGMGFGQQGMMQPGMSNGEQDMMHGQTFATPMEQNQSTTFSKDAQIGVKVDSAHPPPYSGNQK